MLTRTLLIFSFLVFASSQLVQPEARAAEVTTGKAAARKYFSARKGRDRETEPGREVANNPGYSNSARYLALHLGGFVSGDVYYWGNGNSGKHGDLTAGVTYRIGEWSRSMDLMFRADFNSYSLNEGSPLKMSLMPLITFPDAKSGFPLYFGGGVGLGVFLKQIPDESDISLDYQVIAGARFFNVIESVGLIFEAGLKNHVHFLSDGQSNGYFVAVGTVFTF